MLIRYSTSDLYQIYTHTFRKIADVKYASAVLQWDQETYLPPSGAVFRGQQIATLNEIAHQLFTESKTGDLLTELQSRHDLTPLQRNNVSLSLTDYNKLKKISPEFVKQLSKSISAAFHSWIEARKQNDFSVFKPLLGVLITLKQQEAAMLGYTHHPYNALMDEHEKGATVVMVDKVFAEIQPLLQNLLSQSQSLPTPDDSFLNQHFPKNKQWEWSLFIARRLGFDFDAGRQDISEHPFSTNFNSNDVRITTRIDENDFGNMTWSTIHEVGHALYEQGLPAGEYGLPSGEYASLSIHESQSRLWENCVGRSEAFWTYFFPELKKYFPEQFASVSLTEFVNGINKVKPSLIRTEADELTYHFHVMIRYELEKHLISGDLSVNEIPVYWNDLYKKLLNVDVPDDKNGCLQDVHWSHGSFGYFPTYSLGSFYAAQFWQKAKQDVPMLEQQMANNGDTQGLLTWLRTNIHAHGRQLTSEELCVSVTGSGLNSHSFIEYFTRKMNCL